MDSGHWQDTPCRMLNIYRRFEGVQYLRIHDQAEDLKMKEIRSRDKSVTIY